MAGGFGSENFQTNEQLQETAINEAEKMARETINNLDKGNITRGTVRDLGDAVGRAKRNTGVGDAIGRRFP